MLPDLQLICHPPSNGGIVWRIDACATHRVAVFSAYATILEFAQLLVYHAHRLQLIQLGVIQYICITLYLITYRYANEATGSQGVVSSSSEWVGAFHRPRPPPAPPACYSVTPVRCTHCPLRAARSTRSLLRRTRSLHPLLHSLLPVTIPLAPPPLATPPHLTNPLAALPHHRTTAPNACTTSPACCLGLPFPCFPNNLLDRVYPTLVTSPIVLSGSSSLRNHPNSWSAPSVFPTTTTIRFPSPVPVLSSSESF
ncbi:hypothetical protein B0H14DRAFT_3431317 [Mycena olivaceomarginata]|nr:hypothetical protein B0H14DRAFT_3431317 [Mycena olivaceomarginata]